MNPTSHSPELDLLRRQVADLACELAERDRVLHERTRHLQVAQALAHLGSWNWDIASGKMEWSDELYRIFGYEPQSQEMTFDSFVSSVLPDDHDRVLTSIDDALAGAAPYDMECRIVRPDGEVRTIHCCGEIARDSSGQPLRMSGTALDITDRKRTELALQQREAHFRTLIEYSSDVITALNMDGTIRFESPSVERLLGYAQHQLNGRSAFEFVHHEDLPALTEKFRLLIERPGTSQHAEFRVRHKDGSWRNFEGIGRVIRDPDGRCSVIVNSRDITEWKRTEAMLRTSQEKLRQSLRASGTGLWDWDTETNEVTFSEEWKYLLGYEPAEISDSFEAWTGRLHPEDCDAAIAYARDYVSNGDGDYRQEFRLKHKDGGYRWIESRASFVTEADGRRIRLLGSHADITNRKRMEESVRESEERYRTLVELSPSGVFVFSEGRMVYINHTGAVLLGAMDAQDILDRPTFEFIHPDYHEEVRMNVERLLNGGVSVHSAERIYLKMDGTPIPVQVEAARITWTGKPAILGLFSDITERKRTEEQLRESEERFSTAFRTSPHLIGITELETGRCIEVNDACLKLYGFDREEVIGNTTLMLGIWPDLQERTKLIKHLRSKGSVRNREVAMRMKNGDLRQFLISVDLIALKGERCLLTIGNDITERKQAEKALADLNATLEQQVCERTQALRQSEEHFRQFFDNAPNVTALKDHNGRYVYTNRQFDKVFRLSPGIAIGKTDEELFSPEQAAQFQLHDQQVLLNGCGQEFEQVTQQEDGPHTSIVVRFPITDTSGQLSALGVIATDITERKRTQEQLRLYQEIFTHSIDGIEVINPQGWYLLQNRAHERILGYTTDELKGKTPAIHLGEESFAYIARALAATGSYRGQVESRTSGGATVALDLTAFAVKDAGGQPVCYVGIMRDVTERNRAQAALRESEARFQQFAESVGSAFWIADLVPNGETVVYANSAFTRIWGISREEWYQSVSLWFDSIHPDDRTRVEMGRTRFVSGGLKAEFDCEYRIVDRDGRIRWISDRRVKMAGWDQRVAGIAEDITDHRQQLALMAQTEAVGKIGGWEIDFLTNHLWWSDETYRLHDTTPELYSPTVGTAVNFYAPESRPLITEALQNGMGQGKAWDLELELITAKERRIAVRVAGKVDVVNGRTVRAHGTFQDITERKRAEEALRKAHAELERKVIERTAELKASEERYTRATAIGKVGVWELDVLTGQYHGDTNLKALFGYAPEELSTDPYAWLNLVHPDDRPIVMKNWELLRSGISDLCHYEVRLIKNDGSLVWADVRGRSVRDQGGQLTNLIGATVDITDRKQAEQALGKSRQAIRALHDISSAQGQSFKERVEALLQLGCRFFDLPIGMETFVRGDELEVGQVNAPGMAFHPGMRVSLSRAYCSESLRQSGPVWFEHAGASPEWQRHPAYAALKLESYIGTAINGLERTYGTLCFAGVEPRNKPFTDSERDFIQLMARWLGGEMDRQSALDALRQSEERYRTLYDETPSMYFTVDGTGVIRSVNQYGAQYLGYRVEDLVGKPVAAIFFEEDRARVCADMQAFFRHPEGVAQWELRKRRSDGVVLWVRELARVLQGRNGESLALIVCEDITEHKHSEEALRASEERFAKAFQASPHPVVISEVDSGRVLDTNDAACQLFGYHKEEVVGRTTLQIGLWPSMQERDDFVERLKGLGSVRNMEVTLQRKDGDVRQCLLSSELIELNGKLCSVTVGDDITERKRMERALRRTQFSVDQAVEAILWVDQTGRIFNVNETACRMLGYTRQDLMTMTVHDIDPNFPVERWPEHWSHIKERGALAFEAKFWSRTGCILETDMTVKYLQYEGKEYGCMILRDIGDRKRAEAELHRSHTFLRQVIDTDPDLIFAKDREGRFTMANKAVADWYGTTVENLLGKSDADFNARAEEVEFSRQSDLEVIHSGMDRFIPEERITDAGGRMSWLQSVKRPIFDDKGRVHMVLGAATDITERKRMEEILLQRERDLSAALQERERISQDLHDGILQSLYAVGLGLEACKPLIKNQQDHVAEKFMSTLDQAIGQLNQVMTEVRNFIAGLESQVIQGGDFSTALRTMVETMSLSSSARCRVRIDEAAARRLSTEQALHIINIVREGLSNALRHSRAKQITVSLRDLIRSDRLAVTDDGVGFNTRSVLGIGHGLVNMAARAQKVRGLFAIQSKPDRGTRISLDLPKDTHYAHH